jgi:NAD(P)-dependent dehydrogenase (short-subunit alcohol dehydrogenase family)
MTAHHHAMRLQDQVILITGSTTGIGAAMARRFVAEGACVILHGRDVARGEKLREELGAENTAFIPRNSPKPQWSALEKSTPW